MSGNLTQYVYLQSLALQVTPKALCTKGQACRGAAALGGWHGSPMWAQRRRALAQGSRWRGKPGL